MDPIEGMFQPPPALADLMGPAGKVPTHPNRPPILYGRDTATIDGIVRARVDATERPARPPVVDLAGFFDRVAVISLRTRPERLKRFWRRLAGWPLAYPRVHAGVDGSARTLGVRSAGCLLSHLAVLNQAIIDGVERLLVLEDDAEPVPGFRERCAAFLGNVPDDWEAILLGGERMPDSQAVDLGNGVEAISGYQRMHAYALRGDAIRSFADYLTKCVGHCDARFAEWQDAGHRTYKPREWLVDQAGEFSDLVGMDVPKRTFGRSDDVPDVGPARPETTAFITLACYPPGDVDRVTAGLRTSAERWGVPVQLLGIGERYDSHSSAKIIRLRRWIEGIDARHVVYLDAKDTIINGSPADFCAALQGDCTIGAERGCWPDASNANQFPDHPSGRRWPCAGVWMASKPRALHLLNRLHELLLSNTSAWHRANDQYWWHRAVLDGYPIRLDHDGRLAANMYTQDFSLPPNSDFDLADRVLWRGTSIAPCVLHFTADSLAAMPDWADSLKGTHEPARFVRSEPSRIPA